MKNYLLTLLLFVSLVFVANAQKPLILDVEVEFPSNQQVDYSEMDIYVTVDNQPSELKANNNGSVQFRFYPQSAYKIAFVMKGYVTKTIFVDLTNLDKNLSKKQLTHLLLLKMEPTKGDFEKVYTLPNLEFSYSKDARNIIMRRNNKYIKLKSKPEISQNPSF